MKVSCFDEMLLSCIYTFVTLLIFFWLSTYINGNERQTTQFQNVSQLEGV